uniref:Uncharacterized protein n=1 Tax=Meloidogyne hapla TaxID=6305 RepID=A0A1I8BK92_MELHA
MVYNLLINDKINDEEKIRKEINKYISKKEKKGKKGNKLSNLERVIKSCNQDKYEDIPKMDEILMFLKGHITLFPYEERERERMVNLEHESLKRLYGESGYDERSHGKSFLRKLFPCF